MCGHPAGTRCASDTRGRCDDSIGQYTAAHPNGPVVDPVTAATVTARGPTRPAAAPQTSPAAQRERASRTLQAARADVADIIKDATRRGRAPNTHPGWSQAVQALHRANVALTLIEHPELNDLR